MPESASLIDVLDRVLDKGIVIDAYVRVAIAGIDVISVDARVVVASIETYFAYSDALAVSAIPAPERRPRPLSAIGGIALGS